MPKRTLQSPIAANLADNANEIGRFQNLGWATSTRPRKTTLRLALVEQACVTRECGNIFKML
jgi:hypothetical protein